MTTAPKEDIKNLKEQLNQIQTEIDRVESVEKAKEAKDLLSWVSPGRVFRKRDKKWFTNIAILALCLIVILLFIKEFIVIGVVLALLFVYYVLATVPPEQVTHKITTQGVTSAGHAYLWRELTDFWFTKKQEQIVLNIGTKLRFPGRLIILLGEQSAEKIKEVLSPFTPYREIPKISWLDKMADSLYRKLPAGMK